MPGVCEQSHTPLRPVHYTTMEAMEAEVNQHGPSPLTKDQMNSNKGYTYQDSHYNERRDDDIREDPESLQKNNNIERPSAPACSKQWQVAYKCNAWNDHRGWTEVAASAERLQALERPSLGIWTLEIRVTCSWGPGYGREFLDKTCGRASTWPRWRQMHFWRIGIRRSHTPTKAY